MRHLALVLIPSVLLLAWLTAAATSIRVASRIWMRDWVEHGGRGADLFRAYLERPQRLLAVAAAASGLVLLATGATLDALYDQVARDYVIAMLVSMVALAVLGQSLPRAVARRWPTVLAPILLPPLRLLALALTPIGKLGTWLRPERWRRPSASIDPFEELLREGLLEGVGSREEIATISTIVQFAERKVGQVMTPRHEIFAVDESVPPDDLAVRIARSRYSRVPIVNGSLDKVVGMLHAFDLLKAAGGREELSLRPVLHVDYDMACNELLIRMLRSGLQLGIVRDGTGRTVGLVTLEDLLEELVGDIRDEHDDPAVAA